MLSGSGNAPCRLPWLKVTQVTQQSRAAQQTAAGHCNLLWAVNTFLETVTELTVHTQEQH